MKAGIEENTEVLIFRFPFSLSALRISYFAVYVLQRIESEILENDQKHSWFHGFQICKSGLDPLFDPRRLISDLRLPVP
jgi:hypothetical protein